MSKINFGDIFELTTPKGFAYLHYIDNDNSGIEVIRVLDGLFTDRPVNFDDLIQSKEKFIISFPLKAAYKKGIVKLVDNSLSDRYSKPLYMRTPCNIKGEHLGWHIVNTNTLVRELVTELTPAQKKLSPWGIWNDTLLIDRLSNGWSLENWTPWD